ncbi:hypothetical protein DE4576_04733 [Mycobacterium marinum]|nr:hypothetical protein DE4576_04733 [Mycobacterium marinum]
MTPRRSSAVLRATETNSGTARSGLAADRNRVAEAGLVGGSEPLGRVGRRHIEQQNDHHRPHHIVELGEDA